MSQWTRVLFLLLVFGAFVWFVALLVICVAQLARTRCECGERATRLYRGKHLCATCQARETDAEHRARRSRDRAHQRVVPVCDPREQIAKERIRTGIAARDAIHGVHWRRM